MALGWEHDPVLPNRDRRAALEIAELAPDGYGPHAKSLGLVGSSRAVVELGNRIAALAPSPATVFVHGETGTGKELIARAHHSESPRSDRPLRARERGPPLPGRDRRREPLRAEPASARAPGRRAAPRRRRPGSSRRRAHRGGDPPRPGGRGPRRALSGGSLLQARRPHDTRPLAPRAERGRPAPDRAHPPAALAPAAARSEADH